MDNLNIVLVSVIEIVVGFITKILCSLDATRVLPLQGHYRASDFKLFRALPCSLDLAAYDF